VTSSHTSGSDALITTSRDPLLYLACLFIAAPRHPQAAKHAATCIVGVSGRERTENRAVLVGQSPFDVGVTALVTSGLTWNPVGYSGDGPGFRLPPE